MSQFLPIKHKTVPLGTYQIVSGSRRVCLVQDKNDPLVADSLISESDCASVGHVPQIHLFGDLTVL